MSETIVGLEKLGLDGGAVQLEAASLMYHSASYSHSEACLQDNNTASAREFQSAMVYFLIVRQYCLIVSLDVVDPEAKRHEHDRGNKRARVGISETPVILSP